MAASAAGRSTPPASPTLAAATTSSARSWRSPPPYRATPGRPVYVLHASDRAVVMGEDNLTGSLRQLVTTVLAAGDPCLCSARAGGDTRGHRPHDPRL